MGSGIKKIAVNVTSAYDLKQAHEHIINYLYSDRAAYQEDVRQNKIRIDYFVCHSGITEDSGAVITDTVSVFKSVPRGMEFQLNRIRTDQNRECADKFRSLLESLYLSWINSQQLLKQAQNHIYSLVINYSPKLQHHRAKYSHSREFRTELDIFNAIIYEPRWLKIDYDCYVTSVYGFNKTVNFWQFMPYITTDTFKIWVWYNLPEADRFVLPLWLQMQAMKVRSINEL
jgi:hypothetical protein